MGQFRLKACEKCRGDLAWDDEDWTCLQCGTCYYTGLYRPDFSRPRDDGQRPLWEYRKKGSEWRNPDRPVWAAPVEGRSWPRRAIAGAALGRRAAVL